jgi:hypothetical protein
MREAECGLEDGACPLLPFGAEEVKEEEWVREEWGCEE